MASLIHKNLLLYYENIIFRVCYSFTDDTISNTVIHKSHCIIVIGLDKR